MPKVNDLTGKRFGKLTVIQRAENDKYSHARWLCKCDCGNTKVVNGFNLCKGYTKSCGCYNSEIASERTKKVMTKHGFYNTKLYKIYSGMKNRCYNKQSKNYKNYGMRGIRICDEWLNDYMCFHDWAMNNGYSDGMTIERNDVDGNYEPSNCKWITLHEQQFNKTDTHYLTYDGKTQSIAEWSIETGIKYSTLVKRIKSGWSVEDAITKKVNTSKSHKKAGR